MNFTLMILRGKNEAIKQKNQELKSMKIKQEERNIKKEAAGKLWSKIQKLYRLQTGHNLQRIEMKDYATFTCFLDDNQISKDGRKLLAEYMSHYFSHKVCYHLKN